MRDTPIVLTWDWKEQPDVDALASAVREVSGETCHIRAVDTGGDEYAIVVSHDQLDRDEVQHAWLAHLHNNEGAPTAPGEGTLYGLRCSNPHHRRTGDVYVTSRGRHRLASLADGGCAELVVSRDGGKTWQVT